MSPDKNWEYVYPVLDKKYDMHKIKRIFVYSDEGTWIKNCKNVFDNIIHIMDAYHLGKTIKKLIAALPDNKKLNSTVLTVLKKSNIGEFKELVNDLLEIATTKYSGSALENRERKIIEEAYYILNNWELIENKLNHPETNCCTESMISHLLSARLSRNPMGWSKIGLSKMTMLRVYIKNGEQLSVNGVRREKISRNDCKPLTSIEKYEKLTPTTSIYYLYK